MFAGKVGTGLRHEAAARSSRAAGRARDRRAAVHEGRRACRGCARTGCVRRSSCRSRSSSGPCTASCAIRGCSASASTRPRATSCGSARDHPSREGAVPRRRDHKGRAGRVLRSDRAGHAAAHPAAAGHDGALSRRHRPQRVHAEGRVEGLSRVARARRGAEEGRRRPPSARHRHALAALDGRTRTPSRRTCGRRACRR